MYHTLIKFGTPKKVRLIKTRLDGTQSKVKIGNYLSSRFPVENGLKQRVCIVRLVRIMGEYNSSQNAKEIQVRDL